MEGYQLLILTKRLTEKQKEEIVKSFKSGTPIDILSQKYTCTKSTIIRNLKKNLDSKEYNFLVIKNKNENNADSPSQQKDYTIIEKSLSDETGKNSSDSIKFIPHNSEAEALVNQQFMEIAPLDCQINNETQRDLSSVPISEVKLPKIVYMVVDQKIELETKLLKDYPEWQFLSSSELKRKTIQIYFDLKIAKRFCNKEQKVIKVPNTDVFKIAAKLLLSRGITRIVTPENLISL